MAQPANTTVEAMLFERNDARVLEAFRQGEFDYVDAIGEVSEADFLRAIAERKVLTKLAATYPSPRERQDVPLWVYLASDLSMRFHGVHSFHAFKYLVRFGGLIEAFGPTMGHKVKHPGSGDITLRCDGFNEKNDYDRETPCDQDTLRKLARDTDAELLHRWFNKDVVGIFKQHQALDAEGIFIGDATYLFVPDNPKYEHSSVLLFDEHNHGVDPETVTPEQMKRCQWRRCYKLVSLLHTNRAGEFFLYGGLRVTAGKDHEGPILYELVEAFIRQHGRGVMKRLILDRGFIDGPRIGHCKKELGIDILIPVRGNSDVYTDVVGMAEGGLLAFRPVPAAAPSRRPAPVHRPERIRKREAARQRTLAQRRAAASPPAADVPMRTGTPARRRRPIPPPPPSPAAEPKWVRSEVAAVPEVTSFTTCPVPVHAVVNREVYDDGSCKYWVLIDTAPVTDPVATRQAYGLRPRIEERHRQLKCFSDLEKFTSRAFDLVVHQVVFVLLTYSLLQWHWQRQDRADLTRRTRPRALELLRPTLTVILIYYQNYVARLTPLEYQELLLTLKEAARRKILAKTRRLRRGLAQSLTHPRPP